MPQKPFVMRVYFYLSGGQGLKSLGSAAHHVAYMGSRDKDELLIGDGAQDSERTTLESAAVHAQYAGERPGSLGYFGSLADRPQDAQQSIMQAQGPVWRVIASVGEGDAQAMGGGLLTKAGWEVATKSVVEKMTKQLGLDPAKVQWIAAVHRNQHHENNPHVHLLVWETGTPTRKTAKWADTERRTIRKDFIASLYAPERETIGKEKTQARQEARELIRSQWSMLNEAGNSTQGFRQELAHRLQTLGQMLPGKGRLAYAYMPEEVKAQVADTIHWLWAEDPALKAQHDRYLDAAEKMATFYWHADEDQSHDVNGREAAIAKARQNAEADLVKRLAAEVLKAAHTEAWRAQWHTEHEVIGQILTDETIRQVIHGRLTMAELVEAIPALRRLRQEAAFRIFEPFSEPFPPSQFAGTIYHPPASARFTFPFSLTERPEQPEKPLSSASRFRATTWTPTSLPRSFTFAGLNKNLRLRVPDSAFPATVWTPPRPRTWIFMGPQETAIAQQRSPSTQILAMPFDLAQVQKRQSQITDRFIHRLEKHIQQLAWERGVMPSHSRRGLTPNLHAALMRAMHQAERDAARTAYWLAESQYQRQKAERAIAQNTGQEIAL